MQILLPDIPDAERTPPVRQLLDIIDLQRVLTGWVTEGRTAGLWGESTVRRVAQGLLATLRFSIRDAASGTADQAMMPSGGN